MQWELPIASDVNWKKEKQTLIHVTLLHESYIKYLNIIRLQVIWKTCQTTEIKIFEFGFYYEMNVYEK